VLSNLVSEETNVKQVASKVQLGEADAGVVYSTDVTPALRSAVRVIEIPPEFNVIAKYPLAVVEGAGNEAGAWAFIDYVMSPAGQGILARHGFLVSCM
jgi:molybdate transport system substrate-binding protein